MTWVLNQKQRNNNLKNTRVSFDLINCKSKLVILIALRIQRLITMQLMSELHAMNVPYCDQSCSPEALKMRNLPSSSLML